ncbi:hypothetical protein C0993_011794 [Termitomyces sp. T159_Od127]|nr:hypothetical protein C0993_011794 [Termitomyces sp. T159_Od127]
MTPPPTSTKAVVLSAEEVAEIRTSHAQLQALISQLLSKVNMLPALAPAPASLMLLVPQAMGPFVPPIATVVGVNSASFAAPLSLCTCFPDVNASALTAIVTHQFKAADLHKLNPMNRNKEMAYTFNGSTNHFELNYCTAREYKIPFLVLIPLQSYF